MINFTVLTKEQRHQMMMDAGRMNEYEWMKKYPVGDYSSYLIAFENTLK